MTWKHLIRPEPGYYWVVDDHWTDGRLGMARVRRDGSIWIDGKPAEQWGALTYWWRVEIPPPPVGETPLEI
jgi:hypothetical protein